MTFAKAVITGKVSSDPEKRYTPNGTPVASFDLEVVPPPRFNGQVDPPYNVKVTSWNRLAETVSESLKIGDGVIVEGKLMINALTASSDDGPQNKGFEIEANSLSKVGGDLEMLIPAGGSEQSQSSAPQPTPATSQPASQTPSPQPVPASSPGVSNDEALTEDDIPF